MYLSYILLYTFITLLLLLLILLFSLLSYELCVRLICGGTALWQEKLRPQTIVMHTHILCIIYLEAAKFIRLLNDI